MHVERCPTCGRPYPHQPKPKRICVKCGKQIVRHEKFEFVTAEKYGIMCSVVQHRDCEHPYDYPEGMP